MVWKAVVTGFGGGFASLRGGKRVIRVWEDELGFEVAMGNEPTKVKREKGSKGVEKWQIARCWEVLFSLSPQAWSTPGTPETDKEFAARRFTSLQSNRVSYSSCVRQYLGLPWCYRRSMKRHGRMYDSCRVEMLH